MRHLGYARVLLCFLYRFLETVRAKAHVVKRREYFPQKPLPPF
jgi:hypothetical protein